ncbi:MAG: hypothetical protein WCQ20_07445 [Synechococcaceae cyanobacterium ELA739]
MLPIQEIEISTNNGRVFFVHLEKWSESHYECKLAALNLGPQLPADATFGPFAKGENAIDAFGALVSGLRSALAKLDATDSIAVVKNPCNTEFVSAQEQEQALGQGVVVNFNA